MRATCFDGDRGRSMPAIECWCRQASPVRLRRAICRPTKPPVTMPSVEIVALEQERLETVGRIDLGQLL